MPRFYFDMHEGSTCVRDETGLELSSVTAAEQEAARAAGEIARDLLADGDLQKICIELRDEHRSPLAAITVSVEVKRIRQRE